jgi:hypothetical protein
MSSEYSSPQLQAHFLELERVLERVESASTFYQVLALKRSATAQNPQNSCLAPSAADSKDTNHVFRRGS